MRTKKAVIIGAGPAGLAAALELLETTDVLPVIYEAENAVGGISRTHSYKGNRIDIGPHRFFSKSDRVMRWWQNLLPVRKAREDNDDRLLVKDRYTRIYFLRRFFDYPVSPGIKLALGLGPVRIIKILTSYLKAKLTPKREEKSLEDFFINRFGAELYHTFYKDYTEKVWGVSCKDIKADWGAQRIKNLSIASIIKDALGKLFSRRDLRQKNVETSLIETFLYPKFGAGQMWEAAAKKITSLGGEIHTGCEVVSLKLDGGKIVSATIKELSTRQQFDTTADCFISSMPIKDLVSGLNGNVPADVRETAADLQYRDLIIVGLLADKMLVKNDTGVKTGGPWIPDHWIYLQEPDMKAGRMEIYNNFSAAMLKDKTKVSLGMEYFCNTGDDIWSKTDGELAALAADELVKIGFIARDGVLDSTVIRVKKAYPAYFGAYESFPKIKDFLSGIGNLYLIGRNGTHRYNNMDHSMLSGMAAAENIKAGRAMDEHVWGVNAEQEYLEEKKS